MCSSGSSFTEVSGETQQGSLMAIASVRAWLVGQDARAYRPIASRLLQEVPSEAAARCAVEIAILDALTRHLQLPLWVFFGGAGTELSTDMTITAGTAADAARAASAVVARGLTTLKVKVGAHSPEEDAERLRAVHQAAPHATLLAAANGGYPPPQAASFIGLLEQMKVPLALFEQPVDPEDWLELAHAPRPLPVLLCADESVRSARDVIRLLREDALQAVNIKPMKSGVVEAIAIWHVARAAGIKLMIGGMLESILAMSFSAHLAAGLGGFSYVDLDTPMFMREHPFAGGFQQRGALLSVAHIEGGHGVSEGPPR